MFKERQKEVLIQQIKLAQEVNLPIIFHCRMAHSELVKVIQQFNGLTGVVHCFTGNWEEAQKYIEMGFYIGFNGIIYKFPLDEVIEKIPIESIVVETDCPYLIPPEACIQRNEPLFVKHIAKRIAKIKNISYEEVLKSTTQNAKNLFKI